MFDPTQPADHSDLSSAVMRSQLTSLNALIEAILTVNAAQVDGTTTLGPTEPATVTVSVDGNTLRFTFGIPQGQDGVPGEVTSAQLAADMATTALNPTSVTPLTQTAYPDYDAGQLQLVMDKLNELITATQRL